MLSREPLHTLQLQTYYDNRQFDAMWTYLQRYELSGDTYLIYEQAVDLYLELTSFRDACYALHNMEDPALLEQFLLNGQLEDIYTSLPDLPLSAGFALPAFNYA